MDSFGIIIILCISFGCIKYGYYKYRIKNKNLTEHLLYTESKYTLLDDENELNNLFLNKSMNEPNINSDQSYNNQHYIDNSLNQTVSTIATEDLLTSQLNSNNIINSNTSNTSFLSPVSSFNENITTNNIVITDDKNIKDNNIDSSLFLSFSHD